MTQLFLIYGITASSFLVEIFGIASGGLIVPAYLALFLSEPARLLGTILISSFAFLIVKFLTHRFLITEKELFIINVLVASPLTYFWWKAMPFIFPVGIVFESVGLVIPGLLAYSMYRHGFINILFRCVCVTVVLGFFYHFLLIPFLR
ncbi:MAG: poly-gamma-glutamate biosynthesis protein PgsC/CapC [Kosmotogaceae bacterium]